MKLNKSIILAGTALAGMLTTSAALAQSTGSQAVEVVVKAAPKSIAGLGQQTTQPKDQSIVNKEYIDHTVGSANFAQLINLVPGVNYSSEDPTGVLSSDLRMHGFDGAHVSVTVDGTPLNDTGNYAIYPGEYAVAESMDHITVNLGQTEVDSPTASAIGGTVNIATKIPSATPGVEVALGAGNFNYKRLYAGFDTGAVGPTGLRLNLSLNETIADKYKGDGQIKRKGFDGRAYQALDNGGFLSVAFTWASNRPIFYYSGSAAQLATYGRNFDYNTAWQPETVTPGVKDTVLPTPTLSTSDYQAGANTNYWALHPNPVDFGDIRGQSRFNFGDKLTLTVDPYLFYTVANGGGATNISESDPRLIGSATSFASCKVGTVTKGVDLNHDGDCMDTVMLYSPSNTRTHRYGVNSSVIYRFTDTQRVQASYTLDYGRHRQTGEYGYIDPATGQPDNVFGGIKGLGDAGFYTADGNLFQKRNRFSIAKLNQFSLNYIGQFVDDKLHINLGVRNPHFERDLNEYCYVYNGGSEYCDTADSGVVAAALAADNALPASQRTTSNFATNLSNLLFGNKTTIKFGANGTPNFRTPFKQTYHFNEVLPNAGASYTFNANNSVYVTYAKGFSAPKTDDLYISTPELVRPETSDQFGAGYRFKTDTFQASINPWASTWNNHIVQSYDPTDPTLSIDRNVGKVKLSGVDIETGWNPIKNFTLYGSAAFTSAKLQNNYVVTYASGPDKGASVELPVKGKTLVMTPDQTYSVRAQYRLGDFDFGVETKYTGKRFISDTNDAFIKSNVVTNLDIEYQLHGLIGKDTKLQLNVSNLFDAKYYPRVSTVANANAIVSSNTDTIAANTPFYYVSAPMTAYLNLKAKF